MNKHVLWVMLNVFAFAALGYCCVLIFKSNEIWAQALSMYIGSEGCFGLARLVWTKIVSEDEDRLVADEETEECRG